MNICIYKHIYEIGTGNLDLKRKCKVKESGSEFLRRNLMFTL